MTQMATMIKVAMVVWQRSVRCHLTRVLEALVLVEQRETVLRRPFRLQPASTRWLYHRFTCTDGVPSGMSLWLSTLPVCNN